MHPLHSTVFSFGLQNPFSALPAMVGLRLDEGLRLHPKHFTADVDARAPGERNRPSPAFRHANGCFVYSDPPSSCSAGPVGEDLVCRLPPQSRSRSPPGLALPVLSRQEASTARRLGGRDQLIYDRIIPTDAYAIVPLASDDHGSGKICSLSLPPLQTTDKSCFGDDVCLTP